MDCLSALEMKKSKFKSSLHEVDRNDSVQLADKLLYLKNRRDCLLQELEKLQSMEEEDDDDLENSDDEVRAAKAQIDFLEQIQEASRLAGVSVYSRVGNSIVLTLDTGYRGEFFSPYYLELVKKKSGGISLSHHSLPSFIPITHLSKEYLEADITSIKTFLDKISDMLYAYVCRREEVNMSKKLFDEELSVSSTQAVDLIELTLESSAARPRLEIQLKYGDLLCVLPSEVEIQCSKGLARSLQVALSEELSNRLKNIPLSQALTSIQEYIDSST
ncbi:hypothetical protein ScPMuIL_007463 [Solemya velum]